MPHVPVRAIPRARSRPLGNLPCQIRHPLPPQSRLPNQKYRVRKRHSSFSWRYAQRAVPVRLRVYCLTSLLSLCLAYYGGSSAWFLFLATFCAVEAHLDRQKLLAAPPNQHCRAIALEKLRLANFWVVGLACAIVGTIGMSAGLAFADIILFSSWQNGWVLLARLVWLIAWLLLCSWYCIEGTGRSTSPLARQRSFSIRVRVLKHVVLALAPLLIPFFLAPLIFAV